LRRKYGIDLDAYKGFEEKEVTVRSVSESDNEDMVVNDGYDSTSLVVPPSSVAPENDGFLYPQYATNTVEPYNTGLARPAPVPSAATFFNGDKMVSNDIYEGMTAEVIAAEQLWNPLCWVVASTESFAHGANDVGNAIGPYAALIDSYNNACPKGTTDIPYWILGLGASGILLGLVTYGHRVVKTLGVDIAVITPQRASASEMATVLTVLIATALAIPVSTTHCAVGAITGISLVKGIKNVNWKTIGNVVLCIFITVPCCALMTASVFGFWQAAVFGAAYPGPTAFNQYCNATKPGPWV